MKLANLEDVTNKSKKGRKKKKKEEQILRDKGLLGCNNPKALLLSFISTTKEQVFF